jgi:nitrate/nitrite-specific signal transduction histidine kinase
MTYSRTFNYMAIELRGLYKDLESKVEARTQRLAAAALAKVWACLIQTTKLFQRLHVLTPPA